MYNVKVIKYPSGWQVRVYNTTVGYKDYDHHRRIKRDIIIVNPSGESEARIADSLEFEPIIFTLLGMKTAIFTLIPFWAKYFKSYDPKPLPFVEGSYCEPPEGVAIKKWAKPGAVHFIARPFLSMAKGIKRQESLALHNTIFPYL